MLTLPSPARASLASPRSPSSSPPSTVAQSGPDLAQALLNVLRNVSHQDTADYVLALIVEMLAEDKTRAAHFHRAPGANEGDAYADLFRVLAKPHWFAQEKALFCLARLVEGRLAKDLGLSAVAAACGGDAVPSATAAPMGVAAQTLVQLVQWCCAQLRKPSHPKRAVPSVVSALAALLGVRDVRPLVTHSGGVELLAPLLFSSSVASSTLSSAAEGRNDSHNPRDGSRDDAGADAGPRRDVQLQYEVSLCAWLLTFHAPALAAMRRGAFAEGLVEVAKKATKEKVARVAVLALRNIAEGVASAARPSDASCEDRRGSGSGAGPGPSPERAETVSLSVSGSVSVLRGVDERALAKLVANLQQRGFADEELTGALADLERGAVSRARDASSWESYVAELRGGSLHWSAAHSDEGFWRECASRLTDNNCELLRVLVTVLTSSASSAATLAVACHDLGEFATHYPAGRFLVADVGGKARAMALLTHADPDVRKHALLCTQKLLVANWQFIGRENGEA